ncbi:dermonecrotic toxin domain-containing protein [Pseudomonas sp. R3-52-08]|uniref:dermonecrotic toxin domain-containing protein n=1 Tax=Pseudomonas sp. R3-52-08 TaxID=1173284 RepID=UPI000F586ABD|nr:DUF6543 domain-containing protein [Pseudomonas sp. R3-52-08]AZF21321.1 hypothetical protein C4J91_2571 [Pseudomonas sp. R3-52-08]
MIKQLLGESITEKYPSLTIDLSKSSLFIPQTHNEYKIRPLLQAVREYLASGAILDFSDVGDKSYYLSVAPPKRLKLPGLTLEKLDMKVIEALIKELPTTLPIALQNALLQHWNNVVPDAWGWLSNMLMDTLRISAIKQPELGVWQRETVDQLITRPDRERRVAQYGQEAVFAYCLETTIDSAPQRVTLLGPEIVLTRTINGTAPALLCKAGGRIEAFSSMDALIQAWGEHLSTQYVAQQIVTRRYEPEGNIFDHQAAMIFNQQQENLGALRLPVNQGFDALQSLYHEITDPGQYLLDTPDIQPELLTLLRPLLPDWLRQASVDDQFSYRRLSLALASAKQRGNGRTFLSDIKDLKTFTVDALLQALQHDAIQFNTPAQVSALHPDDLELTFVIAAGYPGTVGIIQHKRMSLTELAINNLVSAPSGQLSIAHRQGAILPSWLTPGYITGSAGLIERVDIGTYYPQMLNERLLENMAQAQEREVLFADQQSVYLPLLALELSLKQAFGLTRAGAYMVEALMHTDVADQRGIVIRHLSLLREPGAQPDIVSNMYIIEGQDTAEGSHILYRPLYSDPLQEFTSREALFQAIAQPGALQTSVLTWLPDSARSIYANGGFQEPHIVHFHPGDEFTYIRPPSPAQLATGSDQDELHQCLVTGRLMQYLYSENARALVVQADSDSVSNSESRWQVFLEGASLLFSNLLLPLLRGPAMVTGWLFSLYASLGSDISALSDSDPKSHELAAIDMLLNLGLLLLEGIPSVNRARPVVATEFKEHALAPLLPRRIAEQWPVPSPPRIHQAGVSLPGVLPKPENTVLDFSFSQTHALTASQRARLTDFRATPPATVPAPILNGPRKGLYLINDLWHALVDSHWFQVTLEPDGEVVIVDSAAPQRRGPHLRTDTQGVWSVDIRLRLRGGMPPKRIAAERQRRAQRISQLEAEYNQFISLQTNRQRATDIAQSVMESAERDNRFNAAQRAGTRQRFDGALQQQTTEYRQLLESLKERDELGIPLATRTVVSLMENTVNNARKHFVIAEKDRSALYDANKDFTVAGARLKLAVIGDPVGYERFIKDSLEINDRSIQWLELRDRYLDELFNLGAAASEVLARLTQDRPNEISALAIKDLQIRSLKLLVIKEFGHPLFDTLDSIFTPLQEQVRTHSELNALELTTEDRVKVLESLVEHYGRSVDALKGIGIVNADELENEYFARLSMRVEELYQQAVQQLAGEVKPVVQPRRRAPKRNLATAGRPTKKVIKTPKRGTLIGEVKSIGSLETVEVRSEIGDQLLGLYSQRGDEWIAFTEPLAPKPPAVARGLSMVKGEARKLLAMLDTHLRRGDDYRKVSRHPQDVQEVLHFEAARYDKLATELDQAIQALPAEARVATDQALAAEMRQAAVRLTTKGDELRIQLCLELAPTHGNLEYLISQKRVGVARYGERIQLSGERRDFVQEYAVTDLKGYPLWYAHFHYASADAPKASYTAAHLKTREQRKQSYYSLLAKAQSAQAVVDVHRGLIDKGLAERWFLPLAP